MTLRSLTIPANLHFFSASQSVLISDNGRRYCKGGTTVRMEVLLRAPIPYDGPHIQLRSQMGRSYRVSVICCLLAVRMIIPEYFYSVNTCQFQVALDVVVMSAVNNTGRRQSLILILRPYLRSNSDTSTQHGASAEYHCCSFDFAQLHRR